MARLAVATRELRYRELDLYADDATWLDYRLFLFRLYGLHVVVERQLAATPGLADVIEDAGLRNHKVALLSHDLVSLGVGYRDLAQLPRMDVPALDDLAVALGWMYVLEASTLDGRELRTHLTGLLPTEIETASAYLDCYGKEAEARWAAFGRAVDEHAARTGTAEQIVDAAVDCCDRFRRWLDPARVIRARPAVAVRRTVDFSVS
ncbi:MAG: biliverdin-producing heme oxygenase [Kofleriaceae bacterium]